MYQIIWHITWPYRTLTFAGNFLHTNSFTWFWLVTFSRNANFWQNGKQNSQKAKRLKLCIFPTWRAHCSHCLVLVLCSDSLPHFCCSPFSSHRQNILALHWRYFNATHQANTTGTRITKQPLGIAFWLCAFVISSQKGYSFGGYRW